jgi:HAD superfamily hydrolase (TIGR01484 family)
MIENPKSILAFDLDGTLTQRNHFEICLEGLGKLLNELSTRGHFVIPVTGKPVSYAEKFLVTNNLIDRGIIAENAGVYREPGDSKIEVYGPSLEEMLELRKTLGIGIEKVNVTNITLGKKKYEVVVDPDDVSILTIFTDPTYVTHRWSFNHSIDANILVEKIQNIIIANNWEANLVVLPPFPDGAVQIIRKDSVTDQPIDKSSLIFALNAIYPNIGNVPVAMFGDGHNDIPAMTSEKVIPITFANSHNNVLEFVKTKGGYISRFNTPDDLGVVDGLLWLANKDSFGDDSKYFSKLIVERFPKLVL